MVPVINAIQKFQSSGSQFQAALDQMTSESQPALLANKAIRVRVRCGSMLTSRQDKQARAELAASKHIEERSISASRKLFLDSSRAKACVQSARTIKDFVARRTLPWGDDGYRVLPLVSLTKFRQELDTLLWKHTALVDAFQANIAWEIDQDRLRLGVMFDESDYQTRKRGGYAPIDFSERLAIQPSYEPIADPSDWRSAPSERDRTQYQELLASVVAEATTDLTERVRSGVSALLTKIASFGSGKNAGQRVKWTNSALSDLAELADLVPELNIAGDKNLQDIAETIQRTLEPVMPKGDESSVLRDSRLARSHVAVSLEGVMDRLAELDKQDDWM